MGPTDGKRDWTGNSRSVYGALGASNHTDRPRETHDFYATDPAAAEWLLKIEDIPKDRPLWEPACGLKHLSGVFERHGYTVRNSDLVVRCDGMEQMDFLSMGNTETWNGTIVTNPPYRYAEDFIRKALTIVGGGNKVCMFLKVLFLESKARRELFEAYPPKRVWVSASRIACAMNGDFSHTTGVMAFAWFVWEKGYRGDTTLKWFN